MGKEQRRRDLEEECLHHSKRGAGQLLVCENLEVTTWMLVISAGQAGWATPGCATPRFPPSGRQTFLPVPLERLSPSRKGLDCDQGDGNGPNACCGAPTGGTASRAAGGCIAIAIGVGIGVQDGDAVGDADTTTATTTTAMLMSATTNDLLELVFVEFLDHHILIHTYYFSLPKWLRS